MYPLDTSMLIRGMCTVPPNTQRYCTGEFITMLPIVRPQIGSLTIEPELHFSTVIVWTIKIETKTTYKLTASTPVYTSVTKRNPMVTYWSARITRRYIL